MTPLPLSRRIGDRVSLFLFTIKLGEWGLDRSRSPYGSICFRFPRELIKLNERLFLAEIGRTAWRKPLLLLALTARGCLAEGPCVVPTTSSPEERIAGIQLESPPRTLLLTHLTNFRRIPLITKRVVYYRLWELNHTKSR